jgi:uncharacterized membrane protein SpoIIM required for sporulation
VFSLLTVLATGDPRVGPYLAGTALGFFIGGFGHVIKVPLVIVLGILVIGITTALFVIASDPGVS